VTDIMTSPLTVLCIATYEKGHEFLRECRRLGCRVLLLTTEKLKNADWPREAIDEFFYLPREISREDLFKGAGEVGRRYPIDRIVALDDFDVETAAALREHLRVPGMGETTARYFRDKLAMRVKAQREDLPVPPFVHVMNDEAVRAFADAVPVPWMLKPRSQAAAIGMTKIEQAGDLWPAIDALGDRRSFFLLERFVPGDVFHVDALVWEREVVFQAVHRYGTPPYAVAHHGGIFTTRTVPRTAPEWAPLTALARDVIRAFGLVRGVTHSEFILGAADDQWRFLETSARVGGALNVDVVEAETGLNLWREWAKIEVAGEDGTYVPKPVRELAAGLLLTLAREERPDTSAYADPEVVFRVTKPNHAGLIVASADPARVDELLAQYTGRFLSDFYASAPAPERPPD
jgi:biotin carboxylase